MKKEAWLFGGLVLGAALFLWRFESGDRPAAGPPRAFAPVEAASVPGAPELGQSRSEPPPAEEPGALASPIRERVADSASPAILGTVVGPDGEPLTGATVTLFEGPLYGPGSAPPVRALRNATTGADGRFRFPVGSVDALLGVSAVAEGHGERSRNQSPGVDVPLRLEPGTRILGRLLGPGAADARVHRKTTRADAAAAWVRVDDGAGTFTIESAGVGEEIELHVDPQGALSFSELVRVSEPGLQRVDIDLGAAAVLEGVVIDRRTRRPVADARIHDSSARMDEPIAVTDREGRWSAGLRGPPARADDAAWVPGPLTVRADGYLTGVVQVIPRTGFVLPLVPGARVEGRVLDADGRTVAGARVDWSAPRFLGTGTWLSTVSVAEVETDDEGRFALAGVPWGVAFSSLMVEVHGTSTEFLDVAPSDPDRARVLELRLPRGRFVSVRVRWNLPGPLEGAVALEDTADAPEPWPAPRVAVLALAADGTERRRASTDACGAALLDDLPLGATFVEVQDRPETRQLVPDGDAQRLELVLDPPWIELSALLRTADGLELPRDAVVHVRTGQAARMAWSTFGAMRAANGRFELSYPAFLRDPRLFLRFQGLEFEVPARGGLLDWTLPALALCEIDAREWPASSFLVGWRGPDPGLSGSQALTLRNGKQPVRLFLPRGRLELRLTPVPNDTPLVLDVNVEPTSGGSPLLLRAGP